MAAVEEEEHLILSLDDDDLEREIIETVLVKEAVLQRLSLSHKESESRLASEILTKIGSRDSNQSGKVLDESLHKFVGAVNDAVRMCHKSVEKICRKNGEILGPLRKLLELPG